jgi:uncharacterized membrane protein
MRKFLLIVTAATGLAAGFAIVQAQAANLPAKEVIGVAPASVQTVQYYDGWREREWRRHERWEEWRRHEAERRWHYYRGY